MTSRAQASDPQADETRNLLRLASRLAAPAEAADLVQSSYVRALEHEAPVHSRKAWLRKVLVNEHRASWRGRLRREAREQALVDVVEPEPDVETSVQTLEVARVLRNLIDELDADVRLVVCERYFDGESAADIARRHAIPAGTVRWRLKRGLDHLRDQLDQRYGGRRALWAGVVVPSGFAPTLEPTVASPVPTAGGTSAVATKGMKMIALKALLGLGLVSAAIGGVAWVGSSHEREVTTDETVATPAIPESRKQPLTANAGTAPHAAEPSKERWSRRLSQIRAAHAASASAADAPSSKHVLKTKLCESGSCSDTVADSEWNAHVGVCTEVGCVQKLAAQIDELVEGCEGSKTEAASDFTLYARVVGAPDVGTLVETVELVGDGDFPAELQECLTESMYTLDLGPTDTNFDQTITVMLGDAMAALDDETRALVDQVLADEGIDLSDPSATMQVWKIDDPVDEM